MEPWSKNGLKSFDIQQVASYIITLAGTNPPDAKKAEGEIWVDKTANIKEEVKNTISVDTLQIGQ